MNKEMNVDSAIELLKSGGSLDQIIIADLETSKVRVMDALLLAQNGCVVPDGNIVYDDDQIQYDPDFDDVTWGKPVSFKKLRQSWEADEASTDATDFVIKLQVKNADMKQWLAKNEDQINSVVEEFIENMYQADKSTR